MPEPFPNILSDSKEDNNPAILLFGRRFFSDQTIPELLIELLLVFISKKRISDTEIKKMEFPDLDSLNGWPEKSYLEYLPKHRLNLKLFSFLSGSKLETRHESHIEHYRELENKIKGSLNISGVESKEKVIFLLKNLFFGFQNIGGDRTWCAQNFFPISSQLIAGESIWRSVAYKKAKDSSTWHDASYKNFFDHNQKLFLARGGEVLFLQICNALRQPLNEVNNWLESSGINFNSEEKDLEKLIKNLNLYLKESITDIPEAFGDLAIFIDEKIDPETDKQTYVKKENEGKGYFKSGWCPKETWKEGFLFCIEMLRLCQTEIDIIERILLLETACAFQVLRTLSAQSSRYYSSDKFDKKFASPLGYVWAVSDIEGKNENLKRISRRSAETNSLIIQNAVRNENILNQLKQKKIEPKLKNADVKYGYKYFGKIARNMGFMVPRRGTGARFVLNDHLLRFLVLTIVRPGERMTYDSFIDQVFLKYGIAIGKKYLSKAIQWCNLHKIDSLGDDIDSWVIEMLNASGMLVSLSDSCSMIENPFKSKRVDS
ncbi:MAG: hypothetical protein RBR53_08095 [Desulforegulaceae bacterium]|nr:hypothetical protein [Desulforegulaceae bacterium]